MVYIVTKDPSVGINEDLGIYLDLFHGECREARAATPAAAVTLGVTEAVHRATSLRVAGEGETALPGPAAARAVVPGSFAAPPLALPRPVRSTYDPLPVIAARRSVRRYRATPLPLQTLSELLDAMSRPAALLSGAVRLHVVAHAVHAQAPEWFTTAPVGAIAKVLGKAGWDAKSVELWEVNEAFAAVTMAAMSEFKLPHDIVNVHGGACALGHPIGASGARIVVTLLGALRQRGARRGVAALCIGGGEATALAVERL